MYISIYIYIYIHTGWFPLSEEDEDACQPASSLRAPLGPYGASGSCSWAVKK